MTDPVLYEQRVCREDKFLGIVTLNAPETLNSLSLAMIDSLYEKLQEWRTDPEIVCIFLQGAGDKALCAGGDIVRLYESIRQSEDEPQAANYAEQFFTHEYRLDYLIHTYPKPIICWGHGLVMGGGLGLMVGASHRIVTERSRISMPEVTIGLFPDVGGTWFLSRMPEGMGLFLGLTGASCNAADALELGWADYFLPDSQREPLIEALTKQNWGVTNGMHNESNHTRVTQTLRAWSEQHKAQKPEGQIAQHRNVIRQITLGGTLMEVVKAIKELPTGDKWLERAKQTFQQGCPTTAHLVWRQIREGLALSLPEVFKRELIMAIQCMRHSEFREGVRALLIEKDNSPKWRHGSIREVPCDWVDEFFISPWDAHPLEDLGR